MDKIKSYFLILLAYILNPEDAVLAIIEKLLMATEKDESDDSGSDRT